MANNLLTFIDIESKLQNLVYSAVESKAKDTFDSIVAYLNGGKFDKAKNLVKKLSYTEEAKEVEDQLDFFIINCLLYGSSFVSELKDSVFIQEDSLPIFHNNVKKLFINITTKATTDYVRDSVLDIIEKIENPDTIKKVKSLKNIDQSFVDELNNAVMGGTKLINDIAGNLTTSRLVSYGFLSQAMSKGVAKYQLQAVLDNRTSEVCLRLHGQTFSVEKSFDYLQEVLTITDPEELKSIAPFVRGNKAALHELETMTSDDLQAKGIMVPPFHPNCRTILVKVGTVLDVGEYEPVDIVISESEMPKLFDDLDMFNDWSKEQEVTHSLKQLAALKTYYTKNKIDDALRKNVYKNLELKDKNLVKSLDASIRKHSFTTDVAVYRTVKDFQTLGVKDIMELESAVIRDKAYLPTTAIITDARDIAASYKNGVVLEIIVPKGVNFTLPRLYSKITEYDSEAEILLPRGSKFYVSSVEPKWKKKKLKNGKTGWIPKLTLKWYK